MTKSRKTNQELANFTVGALKKELIEIKQSDSYSRFIQDICELLAQSRRHAARSVNSVLVATYWELGRRIVEYEQRGERRAPYGEELLKRLSTDLTKRLGRGFSKRNLEHMRLFYTMWPIAQIQSAQSSPRKKPQNFADKFSLIQLPKIAQRLPLSWSQYVLLMGVADDKARAFYESEALRGGWSVPQLDRQINTQFYERALLSKNKSAMLIKGRQPRPEDRVSPEQEIKNPYVLEFLNLKDEYSENDLEEALIRHLETFLLELGGDFCFVARQKRLRIGDDWYRVDLVFFHRKLKTLVLIELKLNRLTHSDVGQMHLYLNYARKHWKNADENPPVGLILCAKKNAAMAQYALDGLPNKIMASEYKTKLPNVHELEKELQRTRHALDTQLKLRSLRKNQWN